MRAILFEGGGGPEVCKLTDVDQPEADAGEVLIKVAAAGVNRPDVMQRMGMYPPPPGASPIPGLEVSGTIEAVGAGVPGHKVGDKVVALLTGGGYAEYATAPYQQVLPWPKGLTAEEAAGIPETFFTVWSNLFQRAFADEGDSLLVHGGSSGIGSTAIQLGKAFGLQVYTTAGSDEKCQFCLDLGADAAINYKEHTFEEVIKEKTDGRGVDIVLDMVGGDYLERNVKCMADNGRHVTIAFLRGPKTTVNLNPILRKRLTLTGSTLRPRSAEFKGVVARELHEMVWPLLENESIKPIIDSVFPLEDAAGAHTLIDSSAHMGKIILSVG
ncbi:MAG: NAD(P)H-quinone oxidoreductase [Pseudomonadota bacterium]